RADEKAQELAGKARELAAHAAQVQALCDAAPIGIWVAHDAACERITGNHFADHLLGVPIGSNLSASVPPDQRVGAARPVKEGRELDPYELPLYVAARTRTPVAQSDVDPLFDARR